MPQISKMTLSCLSLLTPNTISLMSEFLPWSITILSINFKL
jgi:hypothetical protein